LDIPAISLGASEDDGHTWTCLKRLQEYSGGIYNGGYGDIIALDNNVYIIVYYLSANDQSPWIEGVILDLSDNY
jgi:hypothetical protein